MSKIQISDAVSVNRVTDLVNGGLVSVNCVTDLDFARRIIIFTPRKKCFLCYE